MLKEFGKNLLVSNIVLLIVGLIITIWPNETLDVAINVVGSLIIMFGVFNLFIEFKMKNNNYLNLFIGILGVLLGIYVIVRSESIVSIIHILLGIAVLADGVTNLKNLLDIKEDTRSWKILFVSAIITILLGVLLIARPNWMASLATRIGGIIITLTALEGLFITFRIKK